MPPHFFYFGPADRPLFGSLHAPAAAPRGGVVLCPPFGLDGTRAHWSYRHLAERLAAAGFWVLRFDWHGTGDSSGSERDADRVATWRDDLRLAIDQLKTRAGLSRLALVGMRASAPLVAAVAAARDDISGVALWLPSVSGGAWVAEMVKLHKLYLRVMPQAAAPEPGGEELLGWFAPAATLAGLENLDLLAVDRPPAPRMLVIEDGLLRAGPQLREHLEKLGVEVDWRRHAGQKFLIMVPQFATLPEEPIASIVAWAAGLPPEPGVPAAPRPAPETRFEERPVRFGPGGRLFGIFAPPRQPAAGQPGLLLLNAGAVNRVGPHRLSVELARRSVDLGFAVLRADLSGIGDSPATAGARENLTYPPDGMADIAAAIEFLTEATGSARVIIGGLCSGADLAYQIARRDPRVAGLVMMNPRTFLELDLARVETQDPKAGAPAAVSAEEAARVPAGFAEIAGRGVETLLLVSARDPGIAYVDRHAPAAMRAAETSPGFRRVDIPGTDHTFTSVASQRQVNALIGTEFLSRYRQR